MKIDYASPALGDLDEIAAYLAERNPPAAQRVIETIRESVEKLADLPSMGRAGEVPGTRELVVTPYVVTYQVVADEIQVLAILHAARERERLLQERLERERDDLDLDR